MRLLFLYSLLLSVFTSCVIYHPYANEGPERMTTLAFAPREGTVDVFFQGESKPEKDYLRLGLVKQEQVSGTTAFSNLLKELEAQALALGADGLLVMGVGNTENIYTDIIIEDTYSVPKESIWGIAIKYLDNISYENGILYTLQVEPQTAAKGKKGGVIVFNNDGNLTEKLPSRLAQYVYWHSLEYLLDQEDGWSYNRQTGVEYPYDHYLHREQATPLGVNTRLRAKMKRDGVPAEIRVSNIGGRLENKVMTILANEAGEIVERRWKEQDRTQIKTTYTYDSNGRRLTETYTSKAPGSETYSPMLTVDYEYLSEEVFREQLEKEQIVRVSP